MVEPLTTPFEYIMVVDDDPINLRYLSMQLKRQGYAVRSLSEGRLALQEARQRPPGLVLLDVDMPDINGYEVCRLLKEDKVTSDIPVIFISVLGEMEDKVKAFSIGGVDYITKPFQLEEVMARVKTHMSLQRLQHKLRQANRDLAVLNSELEQRVTERTQSLQEEVVERKSAEEALRESEEILRALLNANQEETFLMDMEGVVLIANEAAAQRLNTDLETFIGACSYDFLPAAISEQRRQQVAYAMQSGKTVHYEEQRGTRNIDVHLYPVFDPVEGVDKLAYFGMDITKRKQAEEELRQRLDAEHTLANISSRFVQPTDFDNALAATLEDIGKLTGAERTSLFLLTEEEGKTESSHSWYSSEDLDMGLNTISVDSFPHWVEDMFNGQIVQVIQADILTDTYKDERIFLQANGIHSFLLLPVRSEADLFGAIALTNITRPSAWENENINLLKVVAQIVGSALQRVRVLETLEQRVADRTRELSTLNDISSVVSRSLELEEILDDALQKMLETLNMDCGIIYLKDRDSDEITVATHYNIPEPLMAMATSASTIAYVFNVTEPFIIEDLHIYPKLPPVVLELGYKTVVSLPMVFKNETRGILAIGGKNKRSFGERDVDLLVSIGQQIAVAITNAQLYRKAQALAVMEERQRLARELHDSVTQSLYGATLYAKAAAGQLSMGKTELANEHLKELQITTQEALAEMRLLIYELRPSELEQDGLLAALQNRLHSVEERAGLQTSLEAEDIDRLSPQIEEILYRIAQEALNNALKHAYAQNIKVYLNKTDEHLYMTVSDDGKGFDLQEVQGKGGIGLSVMRERIEKIGGHLTVTSEKGSGTSVQVEVMI